MKGESDCCISYYDQIPDRMHFKERKAYFGSFEAVWWSEQSVSLHKSGGWVVDSPGLPWRAGGTWGGLC